MCRAALVHLYIYIYRYNLVRVSFRLHFFKAIRCRPRSSIWPRRHTNFDSLMLLLQVVRALLVWIDYRTLIRIVRRQHLRSIVIAVLIFFSRSIYVISLRLVVKERVCRAVAKKAVSRRGFCWTGDSEQGELVARIECHCLRKTY